MIKLGNIKNLSASGVFGTKRASICFQVTWRTQNAHRNRCFAKDLQVSGASV